MNITRTETEGIIQGWAENMAKKVSELSLYDIKQVTLTLKVYLTFAVNECCRAKLLNAENHITNLKKEVNQENGQRRVQLQNELSGCHDFYNQQKSLVH